MLVLPPELTRKFESLLQERAVRTITSGYGTISISVKNIDWIRHSDAISRLLPTNCVPRISQRLGACEPGRRSQFTTEELSITRSRSRKFKMARAPNQTSETKIAKSTKRRDRAEGQYRLKKPKKPQRIGTQPSNKRRMWTPAWRLRRVMLAKAKKTESFLCVCFIA